MLSLLFAASAASPPPPVGRCIAYLGLPSVPANYRAAVAAVRALRAVGAAYERPRGSYYDWSDGVFSSPGTLDVKKGSVVKEELDPLAHVAEAARASFPYAASLGRPLSNIILQVVEAVVDAGEGIQALRRRQGQALCDIVDSLRDLDDLCASRMPPHVAFVAGSIRVASIACLVEGLG